MYQHIFTALDGSDWSNLAIQAALAFAEKFSGGELLGCHVYAAQLHRTRFSQMEPGLPERYQEEQRLNDLRQTHEDLITDGMELISDSYIAPLARSAQEKKLDCKGLAPEGRNYVELLRIIQERKVDLTILGAYGHGYVPETRLGSVAERVLLHAAAGDVLLMRRAWNFKGRPVVVGVDGSQDSFLALQRGAQIAKAFDTRLEAVAVYDPFFHTSVFNVIAEALPETAKQRFNFPAQEKLHDEIIDRGLETLYQEGLERGVAFVRPMGVEIHTQVLSGKVYPQIHHYASLHNAALVVAGRWGLHRDPQSLGGSNMLNLARLLDTNLLVTAPPPVPLDVPDIKPKEEETGTEITWTPEAEERIKRVPAFVRGMARRSIEHRARQLGIRVITDEFVGKQKEKG